MHRDGAAGRAQDPMGLGEECVEIPEVLEDESAHHRIERRVPERQRLVQVVGDEADVAGGDPRPGLLQHPRREVDRRGPGARLDEPRGVPAGSASQVQHVPPPRVAERFADAWLLQGLQRVGIVVVDRRPPIVAFAHPGERVTVAGHSARPSDSSPSLDHTDGRHHAALRHVRPGELASGMLASVIACNHSSSEDSMASIPFDDYRTSRRSVSASARREAAAASKRSPDRSRPGST